VSINYHTDQLLICCSPRYAKSTALLLLKSRAVAVNVFLVFIAFDGFSFNGVTEVAIESQMDDEIVQAFIDTDGSTGDPNRPGSVGL